MGTGGIDVGAPIEVRQPPTGDGRLPAQPV